MDEWMDGWMDRCMGVEEKHFYSLLKGGKKKDLERERLRWMDRWIDGMGRGRSYSMIMKE